MIYSPRIYRADRRSSVLRRGGEFRLIVKSVNVHDFMFKANKSHCAIQSVRNERKERQRGSGVEQPATIVKC